MSGWYHNNDEPNHIYSGSHCVFLQWRIHFWFIQIFFFKLCFSRIMNNIGVVCVSLCVELGHMHILHVVQSVKIVFWIIIFRYHSHAFAVISMYLLSFKSFIFVSSSLAMVTHQEPSSSSSSSCCHQEAFTIAMFMPNQSRHSTFCLLVYFYFFTSFKKRAF